MKLRIRGNSIRMRLTAGEIARIGRGEAVNEETRFPGAVFTFSLRAEGEEIDARFAPTGGIRVSLPVERAVQWAAGAEVSIQGSVAVDGGRLDVLIEKDLKPDDG